MNWKKFFFAFAAAFVVLFAFGFLWYATLMHNAHREVPTLLRPEADLGSYFGWLALGQLVMAFFFTLLCARYVPGGRAGAGARSRHTQQNVGFRLNTACLGARLHVTKRDAFRQKRGITKIPRQGNGVSHLLQHIVTSNNRTRYPHARHDSVGCRHTRQRCAPRAR